MTTYPKTSSLVYLAWVALLLNLVLFICFIGEFFHVWAFHQVNFDTSRNSRGFFVFPFWACAHSFDFWSFWCSFILQQGLAPHSVDFYRMTLVRSLSLDPRNLSYHIPACPSWAWCCCDHLLRQFSSLPLLLCWFFNCGSNVSAFYPYLDCPSDLKGPASLALCDLLSYICY